MASCKAHLAMRNVKSYIQEALHLLEMALLGTLFSCLISFIPLLARVALKQYGWHKPIRKRNPCSSHVPANPSINFGMNTQHIQEGLQMLHSNVG